MNLIKKMQGVLAKTITLIMGLSMFAPMALAANPLITNVTYDPVPFYFDVPNQSAVLTIDYDYNTGGYPTGPVIEQIRDEQNNIVYEFGAIGADSKATGHYTLQWDGKIKNGGIEDGAFVGGGKYKIYLNSETASPPPAIYNSPLFDVSRALAPELTLVSQPPSQYYTTGGGDFTVNYNLKKGSGSNIGITLKITGPSTAPTDKSVLDTQNADGNYTISWDGKMNGNATAPAGSYTYTLTGTTAVGQYPLTSNVLTGNFTVINGQAPAPTLSNLAVSPNPYDPSVGSASLSYALNGSLGFTTVNAAIYSSADQNTALKTWSFTNQANGTNTFTWDGKDTNSQTVANGSYVFKVTGNDGSTTLAPQQASFTVSKGQPSSSCAGFTDVSASDPDCAAITYVKSIGAMTGNPDGTFAPSSLLQRDQVAKIVLETFNKFDAQVDNCQGVNPFPDVTAVDWAFQYICRGKAIGMITGYTGGADAGYYRPARSVNRVEFLALVLRNLTDTMPANTVASYSDVALNQWFTGYAKYSYDNGLFAAPNLFPTNFVLRVEVARVLYKLHNLGKI